MRIFHTRATNGKPALEAAKEIEAAMYAAFDTDALDAVQKQMEATEKEYSDKQWAYYRTRLAAGFARRYKLVTADPPCLRSVHVQI